jgi:serine phosphatase RsbU (regulator of sigma subunit)
VDKFLRHILLSLALLNSLFNAPVESTAQSAQIDSIKNVLIDVNNDSLQLIALNDLSWAFFKVDAEQTIMYAEDAIKKTGIYYQNHPTNKEFTYMQLAVAYNNLASGHNLKSEHLKAIDNYFKALKIYTYLDNKVRIAQIYNNIGSVYFNIKNLPEALRFIVKSMQIKEAEFQKDSTNIDIIKTLSQSYNNVGSIYGAMAQVDTSNIEYHEKSLEFLFKSLNMKKKLGKAVSIATTYNNIGEAYSLLKKYNEAEMNFMLATTYFEEAQDTPGIALNLTSLGLLYNKTGDYYKAKRYYANALGLIASKIEYRDDLLNIYFGLAEANIGLNKHEEATDYLLRRMKLRDELYSESLSMQAQELDAKYQTEQKEKEIELLNKEKELNNIELNKNKQLMYVFAIGTIMLSLLLFFIYKSYKNKQKINELLEIKNSEISQQKKEITDSINYAKKIQEAILPPEWLVNELMPDNFVYYKPKDIVSGDFYWIDHIKEGNSEKILFAAVDCTGHGVPGALMSVIGLNLLNQAVHEKKLSKPSDILSYLDWGVNQTLRQSDANNIVKDGMDLALVVIDFTTKEIQYAGAYNPLYYIHKGELHEIKADKSPIGINTDGVIDEYTNHIIQLEKGDCIYLFSDGYADQFGGSQGKKFKYKQMKELFLSIYKKPMKEQLEALHQRFENWKGSNDQVDDVIVSGIRV